MDNLPQELVDLIVDQLYFESANSLYWRQTLTRYSMSSTRFRAACLRWLFRSVSVEDGSQSRNLASYRALITSSPCLVSFIQELQVQLANIQLPLLQQILSDLPRLHSLVLVNVSLFGAPTPVKTPLRSLSLSHVTTNDSIVLNTLLGLFLGIEHFKLHVWNPTLLVDDRIDYLNPPLQLKQLSLSTAVTTAVNAQYLFRAIRNAVASCMTLRACLVPLYLEEWGALISSVARSIVNLEFAHVIRPGGLDLNYDLLNLRQCSSVRCVMFSGLLDFAIVVEILQRLPLSNVTRIVLRLNKTREWMKVGALQPLRTVGALLASGAAALESVVIKWGTPSMARTRVSDADVRQMEAGIRLALHNLDERRKGVVEWAK